MIDMDIKKHYKQQLDYFNKEFSQISAYSLAAWQKSYIEKIKKYLLDNNFQRKTLLDIGTGTGYVAIEMAKLGMNVIACDLSPQAIKNLEEYKRQLSLENLKLIECKAEKIPFKDKSVNYLIANAILEHIPDEKKAIGEWKRVVKPGGKIFITVPLKFRFIWPFLWPINYFYDKRMGHLRRYDLNTLRDRFRLPVIKCFYTGHLLKVFCALISLLLKTDRFDNFSEKWDMKSKDIKYGANNICVIFKNNCQ